MPEEVLIQTPRSSDSVTFTILSNGNALPSSVSVQTIETWQEVNRVPRARIVILDGDAAAQTFPISEEDFFVPGNEIEILAGYHSDEECIFKGIVVKHSIRIRDTGNCQLVIECAHSCVKLTKLKKNRFFYDQTETDVWSEILAHYSIENDIDGPSFTHNQLLQYDATDWDYLVSRVEVNNLFLIGEKDKVTISQPAFDAEATQAITFGSTLLSFDAEIDASTQVSTVKAQTWDYSKTEITEIEASNSGAVTPGNLTHEELSDALHDSEKVITHVAKQPDEVLQKWADNTLLRHQLSKVRGRARFQGISRMSAGKIIELQGLGDRFNGKAFVSGVKHEIVAGNWFVDVQFGLNHAPFAEQFDVQSNKGASMQPTINGLQIGIVTQLESDPNGDDRILVNIPIMKENEQGVWARLATHGAGDNRGVFLRPEVGDEVILGFLNDDPNNPIVIGSVNSSNKPTPVPASDDNHVKGWVTRSEIEFLVDDDKKSVEVNLPGGKSLILSEDADEIKLVDDHANSLTFNADGITLESAKDITLKTSSGDVSIEGMNINASAQEEAKIEGNAAAELSASGTTTIKGSLVQIN